MSDNANKQEGTPPKHGFFQDNSGNTSSMRIAFAFAMLVAILGSVALMAGCIPDTALPHAKDIIVYLYASAFGGKAIQKLAR